MHGGLTGETDLLQQRRATGTGQRHGHLLVDQLVPQALEPSSVDGIGLDAHGDHDRSCTKHHCHCSPGSPEVMTGCPLCS